MEITEQDEQTPLAELARQFFEDAAVTAKAMQGFLEAARLGNRSIEGIVQAFEKGPATSR